MTAPGLRRTLHAGTALLLLPALWDRWDVVRLVLLSAVPLATVIEILRLRSRRVGEALSSAAPVFRPRERARPSGAFWLLVGYAAAALAPPPAPAAGILIGALADPAGSLVGSRWGRGAAKSWAGSGAVFAVAAAVTLALGYSVLGSALCAATAAGVERVRRLDDNLVVAPAAALCAALVR